MSGYLKFMGAVLSAGGIGWALFAASAAKSLRFGSAADQIAMTWIYGSAAGGLVLGLAAGAVLFGLAGILDGLDRVAVRDAPGRDPAIEGGARGPARTPPGTRAL